MLLPRCLIAGLATLTILQCYFIHKRTVYWGAKSTRNFKESHSRQATTALNTASINGALSNTNGSISGNPYDVLYGEEFEVALGKAANSKRKTILFWHPENQKDLCFSIDLDRNCGYCEVRDDLSLIEDNMTEAVIFLFGYTKQSMMPKKRNPNQYWIWRTAEPPPGMMINEFLPIADDIGFNMTMTHRDNSDIRMPYADIRNIRLPDPRASLRLKTDLAMAAISNCDMLTGSKLRLEYLNLLMQAGMNITTIGECFPDSRPIPRPTDDQPDPIVRLVSQHKFYFSFENSYHCKDYITEKFFRPIRAGTVPVVWGARKEDYLRFMPEGGFIFAEDYESVDDLYKYLLYLDKNDESYLGYFRWTTLQPSNYREETFLCRLCRFLHGVHVDEAYRVPLHLLDRSKTYISSKPQRKFAGNITEWYTRKENPECIQTDLKLDSSGNVFAN